MDIDDVDLDDGTVASGGWRRAHGPTTMMSAHSINMAAAFAALVPNGMPPGFQPPPFELFPLPAFPTGTPSMGKTPRRLLTQQSTPQHLNQQQYVLPRQFFEPSHWTPEAFQAAHKTRRPATEETRARAVHAVVIPAEQPTQPVIERSQPAVEPSPPTVIAPAQQPTQPVVERSQPMDDTVPSQPRAEPSQPADDAPVDEPMLLVETTSPSTSQPPSPSEPQPTAEPEPSPPPAKRPTIDANAVPTDIHEIMARAKEMRLKTARQPAKKLYESRASGMRPLDVALAEARIITENLYVQRKRRKWEEDEVPICSCKPPDDADQRGCQEDCVNRAALIECLAGFCPCGDQCDNQRIQRGIMPVAEVVDAGTKGLGIQTGQFIKQGDFVGEYLGEIVTEQEYHLRRLRYHNEKHRYMMVLSGGEVIDATRMGGLARFVNHSCDPNCGVEKWEVDGEERCAIFALRDINSGEELTFDYKFQSFSALEITACLCGAPNCRGVIGANNRAAKQPRKGHASHVALPNDQSKPLDPITKKGRSSRKTLELALERMYRALAGTRLFTKKEITMMLDSRLLLKRNLMRHLDDNFRFLCLEPYFVSDTDGEFHDMQAVLGLRGLPDFPAMPEALPKSARQARLEVVLERLRTRS